MIIRYSTKRDINGNRYYLIVNHRTKEWANEPISIYNEHDFVEVKKKDLDYIRKLVNRDYTRVDFI